MKTLVLGIIISAVFVYLSMKGVEYKEILKGFEDVNRLQGGLMVWVKKGYPLTK